MEKIINNINNKANNNTHDTHDTRDLCDRIDDCSGMVNAIFTVVDNLAEEVDVAETPRERTIMASTLYILANYVQSLKVELDELAQAVVAAELMKEAAQK